MSTVIRSCPGCKSLILSDTDQCPECGHVLHERKNSANSKTVEGSSLRSATLLDPCPHCGEMVRTGLVRCWSCNGFMREDIAARYRKMTSNPQQIIYSTIPADQRTDYLPARDADNKNAVLKAYDSEGFVLSGSSNPQSVPEDGFETGSSTTKSQPAPQPVAQSKQPGRSAPEADATKAAMPVDGPDKPKETTPGGAATAREAAISAQRDETSTPTTEVPSKTSRGAKGGEDDLLSIAMQDEREVRKRRSDKLAERKQKQMLVPCACGAWIRVHESQAGKSVRCRKCKQPVVVPQIRRKAEKKSAEKSNAASIDVTWIEGVRFVRLAPTSIVLKPGSVADKFIEADLAITDSQIVVVAFSGGDKKKRGLLGKAPKIDRAEQRKQLREQISKTGSFTGLADVEVHTISASHVPEIRLVQPILKASESMFAGVPVFGDGRIAAFLPISLDNSEQAYCSQTLTAFRTLCDLLKKKFNVELPAAENGVPTGEKIDNLSCFVNQSRVESLRDVIYYEQDPAFELELSGFRCKACTAVISEEGRLKNKLGGANGKAIAKAKCPKCSGKMGEERLYRIKKAGSADATAK
jgi:rRNA maturation protein Nop10